MLTGAFVVLVSSLLARAAQCAHRAPAPGCACTDRAPRLASSCGLTSLSRPPHPASDACEATRKAGGLPASGKCTNMNGANMGKDGEPFYQCSVAPGKGVRHEQKGKTYAGYPAVWW